jgi:large subunit ribosomal protein L10
MPTPQKAQLIQDTQARLENVRGLYLTDFSGLTVESMTALRRKCREQGVQFHVIKNTLLKRAFNHNGITALDEFLVGNTGVVFSPSSEMAPAKILSDFAKENEKLKVKAAVVDGRLFDARSIAVLATLPSREILLSQVLSTFIAPMTQFLAAVNAALATPANMADALHREKSKAS